MNPVLKKTLKILGNVVLYLFMIVALFSVIVSVVSKKDADGTATLFGYQMRFVQSPSMEKSETSKDVSMYEIQDIRVKSMIFIEVVPTDPEEADEWYADLEVGDVLTFKYVYTKQETITHRIVRIQEKSDRGYMIWLEGDNEASEGSAMEQYIDTSNAETSNNYVIGKVVGQNYLLGALIHALKTPVGLICIIIIPCVAVIVLEVLRIVSVLNEEKKQRLKEEQAEKQNEIDELKKMVAQLQQAQSEQDGASPIEEQPLAPPQTEITSEALEEENSGGIDL